MSKAQVKSSSSRRRAASVPAPLSPAMLQSGFAKQTATPSLFRMVLEWFDRRRRVGGGTRLRVAETISLGEKRFVSVVHIDGQRFLIGGSASNVALLTQLDATAATFDTVLRKSVTARKRSSARSARVAS